MEKEKLENVQNWTQTTWFEIWELLANHKEDEAKRKIEENKEQKLREKK